MFISHYLKAAFNDITSINSFLIENLSECAGGWRKNIVEVSNEEKIENYWCYEYEIEAYNFAIDCSVSRYCWWLIFFPLSLSLSYAFAPCSDPYEKPNFDVLWFLFLF